MSEIKKLEHFVLPRLDWYDEEGRIYKDRLIENFNAIEEMCKTIQNIPAFDLNIPDLSEYIFPDVTLADADNKVVNVRSFMEMTQSAFFPLDIDMSITRVRKVTYRDADGELCILGDFDIPEYDKTFPLYVCIDKLKGELTTLQPTKADDSEVIVQPELYNYHIFAVIWKDELKHSLSNSKSDVNVLKLLSDMSIQTKEFNPNTENGVLYNRNRPVGYACSPGPSYWTNKPFARPDSEKNKPEKLMDTGIKGASRRPKKK